MKNIITLLKPIFKHKFKNNFEPNQTVQNLTFSKNKSLFLESIFFPSIIRLNQKNLAEFENGKKLVGVIRQQIKTFSVLTTLVNFKTIQELAGIKFKNRNYHKLSNNFRMST